MTVERGIERERHVHRLKEQSNALVFRRCGPEESFRVDVLDFDIVQRNLYTCLPYKICSLFFGGFSKKKNQQMANGVSFSLSVSLSFFPSFFQFVRFLFQRVYC